MTLTWLLTGLALALVPPGRRRPGGSVPAAPATRSRRTGSLPVGVLEIGSVAAVAILAVGLAGAVRGVVLAAALAPLVVVAVRALHARGPRERPASGLPLALDLTAAALRAGRPVGTALALAAPAVADGPVRARLQSVSGLLLLGADPGEAWRSVAADPVLAPLAAAGRRSADSGIRLADAIERLARQQREQARAAAQARAHRVGILSVAPLGLCFLPAFVALGIVPLIVGIARGITGGVP